MKKNLILIFTVGCVYLLLEIFLRWIKGDMIGFMGQSRFSLTGWTSFWMLPVGGICGFIAGQMNELKLTKNLRSIFQVLIALFATLLIEYLSGLLLNKALCLQVWDYSNMRFNLQGQICLANGLAFFGLIPFAFWLDDIIRFHVYNEEKPKKTIFNYYLDMVRFR